MSEKPGANPNSRVRVRRIVLWGSVISVGTTPFSSSSLASEREGGKYTTLDFDFAIEFPTCIIRPECVKCFCSLLTASSNSLLVLKRKML